MSTVAFAQNMTLIGNTTGTTVFTDPYPIEQYNNSQGVIHTNAYFSNGGTGTGVVTVEMSNDGVNWIAAGGSGTIDNTVGNDVQFGGDALYSLYRLKITVSDSTDWCMYNIDIHVCFKHA